MEINTRLLGSPSPHLTLIPRLYDCYSVCFSDLLPLLARFPSLSLARVAAPYQPLYDDDLNYIYYNTLLYLKSHTSLDNNNNNNL